VEHILKKLDVFGNVPGPVVAFGKESNEPSGFVKGSELH